MLLQWAVVLEERNYRWCWNKSSTLLTLSRRAWWAADRTQNAIDPECGHLDRWIHGGSDFNHVIDLYNGMIVGLRMITSCAAAVLYETGHGVTSGTVWRSTAVGFAPNSTRSDHCHRIDLWTGGCRSWRGCHYRWSAPWSASRFSLHHTNNKKSFIHLSLPRTKMRNSWQSWKNLKEKMLIVCYATRKRD